MEKDTIKKLSQTHDSFYLYDEAVIREKTNYLKDNFPGVKFLYSVKCNPNKNVLETIFDEGFGADAASLGEVLKAEALGLPKEEIYYSAPGKLEKDIERAIDKSVIIADSIAEIYRIEKVAEKRNEIVSIGVRVNPNFTLDGDACQFNKFGIDEDQLDEYLKDTQCPHVRITGLHVHLKSQELRTEKMARYYKKVFALASKYAELLDGLEYVNLGSGLGVEYAIEDEPIDVEYLGDVAKEEMGNFKAENPDTQIMIETGRYITCKSGVYVTKVIERKVSCGKTFLIVRSTLNGFARPSYEQMFTQCGRYDSPAAEPLFTRNKAFQFEVIEGVVSQNVEMESRPLETVTIFGNLCTSNDIIATEIEMPRLEEGDLIVINNAGSYAAVITPMQFSSQEPPAEIFLAQDGDIR